MKTGRRTTDWKAAEASRPEGDRRADDRRANERRAPKRGIDPLFAATLVSQIDPVEDICPAHAFSYFNPTARAPRRHVNVRA